jgi:protein translocase SEC61 complex gamma subunit
MTYKMLNVNVSSRWSHRDSKMLVRRCAKPDKNEFAKIAMATGAAGMVIGFIGFFVKLMYVPTFLLYSYSAR